MAERKKVSEKSKTIKKPVRKASSKTPQKKTSQEKIAYALIPEVTANVSLSDIFKISWIEFKRTWLSYLKIVGVGVGLFIVIVFLGVILGLPLMLSSGGSAPSLFSNPSPAQMGGIALVILWAIASVVAAIAYFTWLPIASIFILANKDKQSLGELMSQGKRLLVPYFLLSLFAGLLVVGGWVLLILPGIILSLLFVFVSFVFVLEGKRGTEALKRSYQMVKENFWTVFVRVLIIQVVLFIGSYLLESLAAEHDIFSLVSFVFSVFGGWFAQVYMYLLYKQIKERVPSGAAASITWIYIVSGLGWLLLLGFITATVNGAMQSPEVEKTFDMIEGESSLDTI